MLDELERFDTAREIKKNVLRLQSMLKEIDIIRNSLTILQGKMKGNVAFSDADRKEINDILATYKTDIKKVIDEM
ncbi:MAG: hypothetical protein A2161_09170 [Candidatus Schekmanbacteria bacterium RBG_13_48_7]|uniref:Uncharacterized protein n=1 Tax=Candidatus Schekmanbacteria bacterium RBG_13_48_7 TaxID=1817878 RepID=A0A1F7S140_9BACT|nr:MAG: hypothetical protein A2161_09170 [Candidatus Schekmanbacteria bacterium RBG_13_48_7]